MKYLLLTVIMVFSSTGWAKDSNLSFGLGSDHAFLGIKYSINRDRDKYYGSLGLLGYSEGVGTKIGYGVGWERLLLDTKHSLGLFLGTTSARIKGDKIASYYGVAATYNYYFSGFNDKSWILGGSVYSGRTSKDKSIFDEQSNQLFIKIAYQW